MQKSMKQNLKICTRFLIKLILTSIIIMLCLYPFCSIDAFIFILPIAFMTVPGLRNDPFLKHGRHGEYRDHSFPQYVSLSSSKFSYDNGYDIKPIEIFKSNEDYTPTEDTSINQHNDYRFHDHSYDPYNPLSPNYMHRD